MSPHRPKDRKIWRVYIPTQLGSHVICATGTAHRPTANAMDRMVRALGPKGSRDWDLLEAVTTRRVTLGALYDAYRTGALAAFRGRLDDIDLQPHLTGWFQWIAKHRAPLTVLSYTQKLRSLMPEGTPFLRTDLTATRIDAWLAGLGVAPATQQTYFRALQGFVAFLARTQIVEPRLLDRVGRPSAPPPAVRFLELTDVRRLVDATPNPERVIFALLYGGGLEISTALSLHKRDIDYTVQSVRAHGTKAVTRDRVSVIAEWAWPIIVEYVRGLLPDAPLFPDVTRISAGKVHRMVLERLALRPNLPGRVGVTMHDARHHWAVRMLRAGAPAEIVARQLGHVSTKKTLDTYGRFVPNAAEMREWESRATEMDGIRATTTARATGPDRAAAK